MPLCLCRFLWIRSQYPKLLLVLRSKKFLLSYLMICPILQRNPHHNRQAQADLPILMLVDLHSSVSHTENANSQTYIVNLHLAQRAGPAIKPKHLVCQCNCLIPLQIRHFTTPIARPLRDVLGPKLLIQPILQRRDFSGREAIYDAFFVGVLDVAAVILIAWPETELDPGTFYACVMLEEDCIRTQALSYC